MRGLMSVRTVAACTLVLSALLTAGLAPRPGTGGAAAARVATQAAPQADHQQLEDEGPLGRTPAALLAKSLGCIDYEPQEMPHGVASQGTCRIDTHRIYVQGFKSAKIPRKYVQGGPGPKPVGADVLGPNWIVHVDDAGFAPEVQKRLGGTVVPAS
jgi:hypothetical protein